MIKIRGIKIGGSCFNRQTAKLNSLPNFPAIRYIADQELTQSISQVVSITANRTDKVNGCCITCADPHTLVMKPLIAGITLDHRFPELGYILPTVTAEVLGLGAVFPSLDISS